MTPEDSGIPPAGWNDFRWIPYAGVDQWVGTRRFQNDVVHVSPYDPERGMMFALTDGLGLDAGAGKAAAVAMEAIRADFQNNPPMMELHRQALRMIGAAHKAVFNLNEDFKQRGLAPAGASAVCGLVRDRWMSFSSVGNVRIFLVRKGVLLQLNRDHLLSLEAEERDILRGEAPELDPEWAKRLTAFLGMDGLQKVDYQYTPVILVPRDRILVISSGLYGAVDEDEMAEIAGLPDPQQAAETLIQRIRGTNPASQSNISAAVIRIGPDR